MCPTLLDFGDVRGVFVPSHKAYRDLEHESLVPPRPGIGTFVTRTLVGESLTVHGPLRKDLQRRLTKARLAGLDEESIEALFVTTFRPAREEDIA